MSDEANVLTEWEDLKEDFKNLETISKTYQEKLEEIASYQKQYKEQIAHQRYRCNVILKNIKELRKKGNLDEGKIQELHQNIEKRNLVLAELEQILPKENGIYLKVILGNVNVSILNREEKFKYKDEYEKFKLILSIIVFVLSVSNLLIRFRPLELIQIFLLVWYYCTLTIRESILKVNGSRIKGWWRMHHFITTVAAAILLIWPDTETWHAFRDQFMWFNGYISVVQYLQFRYQRGQLYRLKALGERHNMDITIEGFHSWMWRGLGFLLPFLFIGYMFQLYNAYVLFELTSLPSATWHVPVLCLMFLVLFVGNIATTVMIVPNKLGEKVMLRYRLGTQRISSSLNLFEQAEKEDTSKID